MSQTTVLIEQIHIGQRFRRDMGDIGVLASSIQEIGLLEPIVISENYQLIAGYRRLEACRSLGWTEVPVNIVSLADVVRGEWAENAERKDFTVSELIAIKRALEPLEKEQAKDRQLFQRHIFISVNCTGHILYRQNNGSALISVLWRFQRGDKGFLIVH